MTEVEGTVPSAWYIEVKAQRDQLLEALKVAADLLQDEGYETDPDYQQEWQTVADALGPGESDA